MQCSLSLESNEPRPFIFKLNEKLNIKQNEEKQH